LQGEEDLDLLIEAPNAEIKLDHGAVSVCIKNGGTCVVVVNGEATVTRAGSREPLRIGAGHQVLIPRDGGDCLVDREFSSRPEAEERLRSLREMLVDVESGVF
ncbi:MAG: hypothetical protein AAFZ65_20965, partial [Planctomycetota bacterium]